MAFDRNHGRVAQVHNDTHQQIPTLFLEADRLLLKERRFTEAEAVYQRILAVEPTNIDAINSLAYCIKFQAASGSEHLPSDLFSTLQGLYQKALSIDQHDVEANFNLGSLYLQYNR